MVVPVCRQAPSLAVVVAEARGGRVSDERQMRES
jgi:hypothetical protein